MLKMKNGVEAMFFLKKRRAIHGRMVHPERRSVQVNPRCAVPPQNSAAELGRDLSQFSGNPSGWWFFSARCES